MKLKAFVGKHKKSIGIIIGIIVFLVIIGGNIVNKYDIFSSAATVELAGYWQTNNQEWNEITNSYSTTDTVWRGYDLTQDTKYFCGYDVAADETRIIRNTGMYDRYSCYLDIDDTIGGSPDIQVSLLQADIVFGINPLDVTFEVTDSNDNGYDVTVYEHTGIMQVYMGFYPDWNIFANGKFPLNVYYEGAAVYSKYDGSDIYMVSGEYVTAKGILEINIHDIYMNEAPSGSFTMNTVSGISVKYVTTGSSADLAWDIDQDSVHETLSVGDTLSAYGSVKDAMLGNNEISLVQLNQLDQDTEYNSVIYVPVELEGINGYRSLFEEGKSEVGTDYYFESRFDVIYELEYKILMCNARPFEGQNNLINPFPVMDDFETDSWFWNLIMDVLFWFQNTWQKVWGKIVLIGVPIILVGLSVYGGFKIKKLKEIKFKEKVTELYNKYTSGE